MSSGQQRGRGARGGDRGGSGRGASRGSRGGGDRGGSGRGRGSGDGCFKCGQPGHMARDCPNAGGSSGGPPRAGQEVNLPTRAPPPATGQGGIFLGPAPAPDPTVTALEDALVKVTRDGFFDGFPGRRGYMSNPKPIYLRTNYFKINTAHDSNDNSIVDQPWYRYEVSVTGTEQLNRQKKRRLLELILRRGRFGNLSWASDYGNIIVTTEELDLGTTGEWIETVTLPPLSGSSQTGAQDTAPEFVQTARARNRVTFRVAYTDTFSLRHIIDYLQSSARGAEYGGRVDVIQLFNIIMCKAPYTHPAITNVGQNKFYPISPHRGVESHDLRGGLEALRGYYASVRPTISRLLLNLNVAHGAFYKAISLIDLLQDSGLRSLEHQEAFIRMLKVRVMYKKDKEPATPDEKIKTIVGFAKSNPPRLQVKRFGNAKEVKFPFAASREPNAQTQQITVYEYFRSQRGITLQRPDLPVLNMGTRADPQYIPQELCHVLPGQPYRKLLSGDQTSAMIRFAVRPPNINAMSIAGTQNQPGNALKLFRLADDPLEDPQLRSTRPFGFSVDTQMLTVPGKILKAPEIRYKDKGMTPRFGSWNCADRKFSVPGQFGMWQVLVVNRAGPRGHALVEKPQEPGMHAPEALFAQLETYLRDYGITMGQRLATQSVSLSGLAVTDRESNDQKIRAAFQKAQEQKVKMLFIVLPEVDRWLYARIKFYGDVRFGIHTINAVGNKLQKVKNQGMFMGNLALKFNIKGRGVSHKVPNVFSTPLDNNTMLVGIDVTHPSPGSKDGAPSIACVVASVDENLFRWPGSIRAQPGRQEMVNGLEEMITERLKLWRKEHENRLPSKIVVYRDGVSEGQYEQVLDLEIPPFQEAFKELYGQEKNWPKMTVIIVGKRHHTRFYPTREQDADRNGNPQPGTVVDRGIVGRILYEFYLQAHAGLQGTARPAHYVVIKDDIKFQPDALIEFTNKLCHLFVRATKAVSICPPAYYADLLCERGRCYRFTDLAENNASDSSVDGDADVEWTRDVHENLRDSTWYI